MLGWSFRPAEGACSAVGSAPEWHSGGHRFDPGQVHQPSLDFQMRRLPTIASRSDAAVGLTKLRLASHSTPDNRSCHLSSSRISHPHFFVSFGPDARGCTFAGAPTMVSGKRFVYIIQSVPTPGRYYTGLTSDVAARLEAHNAGRCPHTASGRPWRLDVVIEFSDEQRAVRLERYLKSGSGCAFAKRHLR